MSYVAAFFLKSVISSGILVAYYLLALRNSKFHQYNRFYLVFTLIASLFLPFFNFRLHAAHPNVFTHITSYSAKFVANNAGQEIALSAWSDYLFILSIAISAILLLMLLTRIVWIFQLKHRYTVIKMPGFSLVNTDIKQAPFSFLNNLFWRKSISMHEGNGKKIFIHELTHIKERHTYDKLVAQVASCILWMNPFYWFIQKELNVVHEFIAYSKSIQHGDMQSFAEMLLQTHNEGRYLDPSHLFFNSSIKRRIVMLTTSKSAHYSWLRRVCALPLLLLVTILISFKIVNAQADPKLHPHDSLRVNKVSIQKRNDSLADVVITYTRADGRPDSLNVIAGYSANDFHKANILYDDETGERREISAEETREIVKQIIQNPPPNDIYFVDGREYSPQDIKKLDPEKIKTINSYAGQEAVKRFGDKAKHGAIVFTTK